MATGSSDHNEFKSSELTPQQFLERLKVALTKQGDFPASAKIVSELKGLTTDPNVNASQVAEVILREPSLGVRVLHLVNSAYFRRVKPITTISQAIVQVGMKPLTDMCAGLVLLQKFVPEARKNGSFALCLRRTILSSILASNLVQKSGDPAAQSKTIAGKATKQSESGYLAGAMVELGTLLTAFYFPQLFDSAVKRAESKNQDIGQSLLQLTGFSPGQLSAEVIKTLNLPKNYADVVICAEAVMSKKAPPPDIAANSMIMEQGRLVGAASAVSEVLSRPRSPEEASQLLANISQQYSIPTQILGDVVANVGTQLKEHCGTLEIPLPSIQIDLSAVSLNGVTAVSDTAQEVMPALGNNQAQFNEYIEEIKTAIANSEPTASIVTSVMEACAFCLKFDRVVLLLANQAKTKLIGRMLLGTIPEFEPTKYARPLGPDADRFAPDNAAYMGGRPVFQGDPLFAGSWPIVAIPVGCGKRAIGVIYAERVDPEGKELTSAEQAAISMLAEFLDRSLHKSSSSAA